MPQCDNCKRQIAYDGAVCPECGYANPYAGGRRPSGAPDWVLTLLGFLAVIVSPAFFGVGLFVMILLYFILKPNYPAFARGIGWGLLTFVALLLGACAICFAVIFSGKWQ